MNKMLSTSEAAFYLGVSIVTMRNWDKKKILVPDAYVGRLKHRRYKVESLEAYLENVKNNSFNKKNNIEKSKKILRDLKKISTNIVKIIQKYN